MTARLPQIRYIAVLTALLYFLYAALELHLQLKHETWRLMAHGVLVPAILLLVLALSFYSPAHRLMRLLMVTAPVGAVFINLWLNIGTARFPFFAPELYLNIIWTFAIAGLTLRYASIAASCSVLLILLMTYLEGVPSQFMALHLLWILAAFLFGFVSALVLERAHRAQYEQQCALALSASCDGLTGLWNRNKVARLFLEESALALQSGQPLAVLMLDVDHFKQVNDLYGHARGDQVLKDFARLLQKYVRQQDHVGRLGGEEFFVLLPNTDVAGAQRVAEGLQQQISRYVFDGVGHKTASFGVAQYRAGESLQQLLNRADQAMYQAKAAGRDRIVVNH